MLFFYSNSNYKSIEKLIFFSFWQDLGFGECFFLFNLKIIENFDFLQLWAKIFLVLNAFFDLDTNLNSIEN